MRHARAGQGAAGDVGTNGDAFGQEIDDDDGSIEGD